MPFRPDNDFEKGRFEQRKSELLQRLYNDLQFLLNKQASGETVSPERINRLRQQIANEESNLQSNSKQNLDTDTPE